MREHDEIDLFELISDLWKEKVIIGVTTVVIGVLAVIYALFATPVYKTETIVDPIPANKIAELNIPGVYSLSPTKALRDVADQLNSYTFRYNFYQEHPELFPELSEVNKERHEQFFRRFDAANIKIAMPKAENDADHLKDRNFLRLEVQYSKNNGVEIANQLIQSAIEKEKENIAETLEVTVREKKRNLERDIEVARVGYQTSKEASIAKLEEGDDLKRIQLEDELRVLREALKKNRENRIKVLDEAIAIAERLNIRKPTSPTSLSESSSEMVDIQQPSGNIIRTEVNSSKPPLYFMGTEALTAEKEILLARESDDFTSGRIVEIEKELKLLENNRKIEILKNREEEDLFLEELADYQKELAKLENIDLNLEEIDIVEIDEYAIEPLSPIKPKKKLIVLIGLILGGMLGVAIALVRIVIRNRKAHAMV